MTAWKESIERTFQFTPYYLVAETDGKLTGVLPLFEVANFVVGKALISTPYAVYGGILALDGASRTALYEEANRLGEQLGVEYVEYRNSHDELVVRASNVDRYVTFTKEIVPAEKVLESVPKKTRNLIRKSLKSPFRSRRTTDLTTFLDLYSKNLRRLGTPSFPPRLFAELLKNFGPMIDVCEVLLEETVVAVSINFYFRDQMHTYYAASDQRYLAYSPNNFLYYDHLCWAAENGYRVFDFGRSKRNTGTFEFKRHWTEQMRALPYEINLVRRKELPNFSPTNTKFQAAMEVWKRMPLPLTRALGPHLVRLFP